MKLLRNLNAAQVFPKGSVVTIGNFDGVHRGHQALLAQLACEARKRGLPSVLILFEPQPSEFFDGLKAPVRLTLLREKLALLRDRVDYVYCLKFDAALAALSAELFIEKYLLKILQVNYLLVGNDFRFGSDRKGDRFLLETLVHKNEHQVEFFSDFFIKNERVSSTTIRKALAAADLERATILLGRTFSLSGHVVKGEGRGKKWGIPTANVHIRRAQIPLSGVYAVKVRVDGQWVYGVANLGTRPTVQGITHTLEVHLLDFTGDLYGKLIQVFFVGKLRNEMKFGSIGALLDQIQEDIIVAKTRFEIRACSELMLD